MTLGKTPLIKATALGYKINISHVKVGTTASFLHFTVAGTGDRCTALSCVETLFHTTDLPKADAVLVVSKDVFGIYAHLEESVQVESEQHTVTKFMFSLLTTVNNAKRRPLRLVKSESR